MAFYSSKGMRGAAALLLFLPLACAGATLTAQDERDIHTLISQWNALKNHPQPAAAIYASQVRFYGKTLPLSAVAEQNSAFVQEHPRYAQKIINRLTIDALDGEQPAAQVSFVKLAGLETASQRYYPAQLRVVKQPEGWRINEESDWITESNQQKENDYRVAGGRFNGAIKSYAWLSATDPVTGGVCDESGDCECEVWNSDPAIKPAKLPSCIGGGVETLAGLDDSGRDRLIVYPQWWTSAWSVVYLYDIQQKQWVKAIPSFSMNSNVQEEATGRELVARDAQRPGQVIVAQAKWDEAKEEIVIEKASVPLNVVK